MKQFASSVRSAVRALKIFIGRQNIEVSAETVIRVIRDLYFLKTRIVHHSTIENAVQTVGLELDAAEMQTLEGIQTSTRKPRDYIDNLGQVEAKVLLGIVTKIDSYMSVFPQ